MSHLLVVDGKMVLTDLQGVSSFFRRPRQFSESVEYLEELGALDMHLGWPTESFLDFFLWWLYVVC